MIRSPLTAAFLCMAWLALPQHAAAQFESKFGKDWPTLKECLEYSDESGEWVAGRVVYRFEPDGAFTASYVLPHRNRLMRVRPRNYTFNGSWTLTHRGLRPEEKSKLDIPATNRNRVHILTVTFVDSQVDPPFDPDTRPTPLFPAPEGGPLRGRTLLLLDEENKYPRPGRSDGETDPTALHWIVLEDPLGFFPKDTAPGKSAWTLRHH